MSNGKAQITRISDGLDGCKRFRTLKEAEKQRSYRHFRERKSDASRYGVGLVATGDRFAVDHQPQRFDPSALLPTNLFLVNEAAKVRQSVADRVPTPGKLPTNRARVRRLT
jgi:hypothetical protein